MSGELTTEASFTRIEEEVRRFWQRHGVPEAFRVVPRDSPFYLVYQQPLLAKGESQDDQVRLLATADLFARYRTMCGDDVFHQMGWSCHGLGVEVAVEQSLEAGLVGYDLAQFNAACYEMAVEGVRQGEKLADRLGVWSDPARAYLTLNAQSIGVVWGVLRRLWDAGRLRHEFRVVSTCPRCATPLSASESVRQSVEIETRTIWLRLPWDGEQNTYLLVWTPIPWMLVGMVAVAFHPDATYALVELPGRQDLPPTRLLLAEAALKRTVKGDHRLVRRLPGSSLRGSGYHPPFTFLAAGAETNLLVPSQDTPLERGTGFLPVTPTFDALSLSLAQAHGLAVPRLLDDFGGFDDAVMPWRGLSPLDAEPLLVKDLRMRGLVFRQEARSQPQGLCPYCETPLLPQARHVWAVETGSGPWIVGRDRAWGTALPVWRCEKCGETLCVAGLDDLAYRTGSDVQEIEPHRPGVDQLTLSCQSCGGTMHRVPAVIDAALEAAVLPWSMAPRPSPADLAIGRGDRHLGWLGDLSEMSALLQGVLAWERSITLPEGEPGAATAPERPTSGDALRWAAYSGSALLEVEGEFLRPLWRLFVSLLDSTPVPAQSMEDKLLDRWLLARLYQAAVSVTAALGADDPRLAAEELAGLLDDVSAWYLPHRPGGGQEALELWCRLLAPFVPHLAEAVHRRVRGHTEQSVHLGEWPTPEAAWQDDKLLVHTALVRRLVRLGQAARARKGIEPKRPLAQAFICFLLREGKGGPDLLPFQNLLARALAVERVRFEPAAANDVIWRLALRAKRVAGRGLTPDEIEAALSSLESTYAADLAAQLREGLSISLEAAGQVITLLPDEVRIDVDAQEGWTAALDRHLLVLLETS